MARIEYVVCPVCGRNRLKNHRSKGEVRFPGYEVRDPRTGEEPEKFSIEDTTMLQVRRGGGKKPGKSGKKGRGKAPGSGFHIIPSEGLTLTEMMDMEEYQPIVNSLLSTIKKLYLDLMDKGLIE